MRTRVLFVLVAAGLATSVSAQQPVITSFESDGTLTWSNAYPNAIASIERLTDVVTTTQEWLSVVTEPSTSEVSQTIVEMSEDAAMFRVQNVPPPAGMVWIPPGTFIMGSPEDEASRGEDEGPQTEVTISRGFWLGQHEVYQIAYLGLSGRNPSAFTGDRHRPVESVTWHEATNYCAMLTTRERTAGRLPAGYEYRLPTEAQWEYACRAGTTTLWFFGNNWRLLSDYAWCAGSIPYTSETHPVGQLLPNPWGLYDVYGNVYEMCQDWYADSLPGGSVTDPTGPLSGSLRVMKGGAWGGNMRHCRSATRYGVALGERRNFIGFRVALVAVP